MSGVFLPLIAIDLDKFRHNDKVAVEASVVQKQFRQLYDPSQPLDEQHKEWKRTALYAERAREVLLRGEIPADAYVVLDRMVRVIRRQVLDGNDADFPQEKDLVGRGTGNLLVEQVPDGAKSSQSQEWKVRVNGGVFRLRQGRPNRSKQDGELTAEAMRHVDADHLEKQLRKDATKLINRSSGVTGICLYVMETHYRTPLFSNLLTVRVPLLLIRTSSVA